MSEMAASGGFLVHMRWPGLAGERRSTAGTAAQGARHGGAERGGALGLVRLRQGEVVGAEGHRGHFKKARASWAGVPRKEISRGIQAGLTRPLRERCAGETNLPVGP